MNSCYPRLKYVSKVKSKQYFVYNNPEGKFKYQNKLNFPCNENF